MRALRSTAFFFAAALAAATAFAGGPLGIYDPATKTPYAWAGGQAPIFLDNGSLGPLDNAQAGGLMGYVVGQWNDVPTSSFEGTVVGDFASIGLPDVDASNIFDVLGTWNGGGVHVVYDADGTITELLFGFNGVLGFTILEFVDDDSPAILEATIIVNGSQIPADGFTPEMAAAMFSGVVTHEFGHAINLAHSQTNGQVYNFFEPYVGPEGCSDPYTNFPDASSVETMFPFINLYSSGEPMGTVDILDDVAVVSDLYPAPGWPQDYATVRGNVLVDGHAHAAAGVSGINVIARNVDNPFGDAISALSGDYTQGQAGPDGSYAFHGLTPGASYILYLDGIWAGQFSVPFPTVLPGPEEYFNGSQESGDGITDDRCVYSLIPATNGSTVTADVTFNRVKDAPVFHAIDLPNSGVADMTQDGSTVVGNWADGMFRWTKGGGYELLGGSPFTASPGISEDGSTIVGEISDTTTFGYRVDVAAVWQSGTTWEPIGLVPGNEPCDAFLIGGWDATNAGGVVGLSWVNCVLTSAYSYTPAGGIVELGNIGDSDLPGSRANTASADGSIVIGWDRDSFGFWRGARWDNGVESLIQLDTPALCDSDPESPFYEIADVGTAYGINAAGTAIVGEGYPITREFDFGDGTIYRFCEGGAWLWTAGGGVRSLGEFSDPSYTTTNAFDVSEDARIVVGNAGSFGPFSPPPRPLLWTEATGSIDFNEFLTSQGTWAPNWILINANSVSGDGRTIAGGAASPYSFQGYVVEIPKVVVCHHTKGNQSHPAKKNSIAVAFPDSLESHLDHGDTIGICGNGM